MIEFAKKYYDLGLNPTCISYLKTKYNINEKNPQKSASHSWKRWQVRRPKIDEIINLDWNSSNGIGSVLGYIHRCIDIDNCNDYDFIKKILSMLGLPSDYEWVVKTPNGFHIHLTSSNIEFATHKQLQNGVLALLPNDNFKNIFSRIELRWANHIVLPPTAINGKKYSFVNNSFPKENPNYVHVFHVYQMISYVSGNYYSSFGNFEVNDMIFQISAPSEGHSNIVAIKGKLEDVEIKKVTLSSGYIDYSELSINLKMGEKHPFSYNNNNNNPLFIDIETTGLIKNELDYESYPRIIQIAYSYGLNSEIINYYIKPEGFSISDEIERITGITNSKLIEEGVKIEDALKFRNKEIRNPIIGHNVEFDISIIDSEYLRLAKKQNSQYIMNKLRDGSQIFCTMKKFASIFGGKYPKLSEMYSILFDDNVPNGTHNAKIDLEILIDCYYLMLLYGFINKDNNDSLIE
jgi:DNA polymerase III epsilon subunit-like protein